MLRPLSSYEEAIKHYTVEELKEFFRSYWNLRLWSYYRVRLKLIIKEIKERRNALF